MLPRWLIYFRAMALACAFAAAFVPIATYITDDKRDWLWIHIGVNIAAYIAVALTTIYTTVNLTQQDHNKFSVPAYWANNVVMRAWYLGGEQDMALPCGSRSGALGAGASFGAACRCNLLDLANRKSSKRRKSLYIRSI